MELDRWHIPKGVADVLGTTLGCRTASGASATGALVVTILGSGGWGGGDWGSSHGGNWGRKLDLCRGLSDRARDRSRRWLISTEGDGGGTTGWGVEPHRRHIPNG